MKRILSVVALVANVFIARAQNDPTLRLADDFIREERSNTHITVSHILLSTSSVAAKVEALAPYVKVGDEQEVVEMMLGPFHGWGHGIGLLHGVYPQSGLCLSFMPERAFAARKHVYEIGYTTASNRDWGNTSMVWLIRSNPAFFPSQTNASYVVAFPEYSVGHGTNASMRSGGKQIVPPHRTGSARP